MHNKKILHGALLLLAGGIIGYFIGKNAPVTATTTTPAKTS